MLIDDEPTLPDDVIVVRDGRRIGFYSPSTGECWERYQASCFLPLCSWKYWPNAKDCKRDWLEKL